MSAGKPLATMECVYSARDQFHDDEWSVVVGERIEQSLSKSEAMAIASTINAAHAAVVEPLLALLARARNAAGMAAAALRRMDNASRGLPLDAHEARDTLTDVCEAIDAANPGEWVPAERLKECQAVLDDLRQEKADVWRGRAARALDMLRMGGAVDYAMAALEGKDE